MEKSLIWYRIFLKNSLLRPETYIKVIGLLLAVLLIQHIDFPTGENVEVGIAFGESQKAKTVFELLKKQSDTFEFIQMEEEDVLKERVERGELECAFVFADDFDRRCEKGDLSASIRYYCSTTSTKDAVIMETIYAALLEVYSPKILQEVEISLYDQHDENRMHMVEGKFEEYLHSNQVFDMLLLEEDTLLSEEKDKGNIYPLQGMIGFLLCFYCYLFYIKQWDEKTLLPRALVKNEKRLFWMVGSAATITIPTIVGLLIVLLLQESRGFWIEVFRMLALVCYSVLWSYLIGGKYRKYLSFIASIPIFVVVNVLICPVFFDIVTYVPAIRFVRFLFPLGIYLY